MRAGDVLLRIGMKLVHLIRTADGDATRALVEVSAVEIREATGHDIALWQDGQSLSLPNFAILEQRVRRMVDAINEALAERP